VDFDQKRGQLKSFLPFMSVEMFANWQTWIQDTQDLVLQSSGTLKHKYFFNVPAPQSSEHSATSMADIFNSLPAHLPSARGLSSQNPEDVLSHFNPGRLHSSRSPGPSQRNDDLALSAGPIRTGIVSAAVTTGSRKQRLNTGASDVSDMTVGSLVAYLKDPDDRSLTQPFLLAKIIFMDLDRAQYKIHWLGQQKDSDCWEKNPWYPWFNVVTHEELAKMTEQEAKKFRKSLGQAVLPSTEVKTLDGSEIFYHSFHLKKDNTIPVNVIKRLKLQLENEGIFLPPSGSVSRTST
jgi:hypothetical protein